jgi:oxygen-independent coproporphyrinogen-3 oxidase
LSIKKHQLSIKEQIEEFMFLGLRLTEGIQTERFQEIFGADIDTFYAPLLQKLAEQKLIQITPAENAENGKIIALTSAGFDISNYILAQFLLD